MKRILSILALFPLALPAQTINYTPVRYTVAISSDGGVTYSPLTSASGIGSVTYTPPYFVPMCSNDGGATYSQCSFSGGGGSVSLTSPNSTLSLSPSPIVGTGTLDLNLTHANIWTGSQTFSNGGGTPDTVQAYNDGTAGEGVFFNTGGAQKGGVMDNAGSLNWTSFDTGGNFSLCTTADCAAADLDIDYIATGSGFWKVNPIGSGTTLVLGAFGQSINVNGVYVGGANSGVTGAITSVDGDTGNTSLSDTVHVNLSIGTASSHTAELTAEVSGVALPYITGSTQCLHVSTAGLISGSGADCGGGTANIVASAEVVSFSATPTFSIAFNVSRIVLTGNITSFTLGAGADGQSKTLCFKQGSGAYTVSPPSAVHGFFTLGTISGDWNCQAFTYDNTDSIWLASTTGVINQ
jgi:hypothetical protein